MIRQPYMSSFNYPWTNLDNKNLDWFINAMQQLLEAWSKEEAELIAMKEWLVDYIEHLEIKDVIVEYLKSEEFQIWLKQWMTEHIDVKEKVWEVINGREFSEWLIQAFDSYDLKPKYDILEAQKLNKQINDNYYGFVRPEWYDTDDTNALKMAIDYANRHHCPVILKGGRTYLTSTEIVISNPVNIYGNGAIIKANHYQDCVLRVECQNDGHLHYIKDLIVNGDYNTQACIRIDQNINAVWFENITVINPKKFGFYVLSGGRFTNIEVRNTQSRSNNYALYITAPDTVWSNVLAVNFRIPCHTTAFTQLDRYHPFNTDCVNLTNTMGIRCIDATVLVTNSYIDTFDRAFFNETGRILCTGTCFFWSDEYYPKDRRPYIAYHGSRASLVNCRIYKPTTTEGQFGYSQVGSENKVKIPLSTLNLYEGIATEPIVE